MKRRRRVARGTQLREMETAGRFDRRAAEMLGLELRMLAKAHGLNVAGVEITTLGRTARMQRSRVQGGSAGSGLPSNAARRRRGGA